MSHDSIFSRVAFLAVVLLLQAAVVLVGLGVLTFLLWELHVEGRNAHATVFEVYFKDPFLAYVYVGSIPFFAALCRAFGLLREVRRTGVFASPGTVAALRTIQRCAFVLLGFVAGGVVVIRMFGDGEDRPAGLFMGLLAMLGAAGMAAVAGMVRGALNESLSRDAA